MIIRDKINLAIYSLIIAVFGSCNFFVNNGGLGARLSIEDASKALDKISIVEEFI